ncbi:MAG: FAD-dependent oxidoreductase, partial [Anaerolineae bacterium]|nr:FAD-dependent oxidoreductase [Anaerolineae bacterium]
MRVGIIGAGPAGLFTAWLLRKSNVAVRVFEAQSYVGGIARSFCWHGFTCDLGAHRLFTNDEEILRCFLSIVPMGRHIRRSRLYLAGKWLRDPVDIIEILYHFFPATTARIVLSYLFRPRNIPEITFDDFVRKRYGSFLNRFFFRPYTEKLFGLSGDQIAAEWARQKVRIASPVDRLRENNRRRFSYFYYPIRGGFGAIADKIYQDIRDCVVLNSRVCKIQTDGRHIDALVYEHEGCIKSETFDVVVSTISLDTLSNFLGYNSSLSYRGVYFVYLLVNRPLVSDNHWLYFI